MDKSLLLKKLPPYSNRKQVIVNNQSVNDIVREVLAAHQAFTTHYNRIAADFDRGTPIETAKELFAFLKKNVRYQVEPERSQTTKSPAALLVQGHGDCKHYAGFIAGVLDALNRQGGRLQWFYRFASYNVFDKEPGHVFVVLINQDSEIWIDPVLKSFNEKLQPTWVVDKKPKAIMLQRVSGVPDDIKPEVKQAISTLITYRVMNRKGQINDRLVNRLSSTLPAEEFNQVAAARILLQKEAAIGNIFSDIWSGYKTVTLAAPRNAFLFVVSVNGFGYATKLHKAMFNNDGTRYEDGYNKISAKWESLGGSTSALENTVQAAWKKPAILGAAPSGHVGEVISFTAAVTAATTIIAALSPIILAALSAKGETAPNSYAYGVCADGITPRNADGTCPTGPGGNYGGSSNTGGLMDFISSNPIMVAGGAAALYFMFIKKKRG